MGSEVAWLLARRVDDGGGIVKLTVVGLAREIGGGLGEEEDRGGGDELHGDDWMIRMALVWCL